jgi:uncharacterized membrane protein YkoI
MIVTNTSGQIHKILSTLLAGACLGLGCHTALAEEAKFLNPKDYASAKDWKIKGSNLAPSGTNPWFFPLRPGHKHILEKPDHSDGAFRKEVQVLNETEAFDLAGVGKFKAAIIQEEEFLDGRYSKQSLKWAAIDKSNNNIYLFGEIAWEIEENGNRVFEHTWRAGEPDRHGMAEPGLWMPGTFNVGARYIVHGSEGESLTGAQNLEKGVSKTTAAGKFTDCVKVREQGLEDTKDRLEQIWCPKVGLVEDSQEGLLIASDVLPKTDISAFGKFHWKKAVAAKAAEPKITKEHAGEIALLKVPGRAQTIVVERKRGKNVYVVEIIASADGVETDVLVDMESGKVLGVEK